MSGASGPRTAPNAKVPIAANATPGACWSGVGATLIEFIHRSQKERREQRCRNPYRGAKQYQEASRPDPRAALPARAPSRPDRP
jgi:hypothetical protein